MKHQYDGEMHPQKSQDRPQPGPHDDTRGDNEDYEISSTPGRVAASEFSDPQDFGDGLQKDPDSLDRCPKTHKSAGM